MDSYDVIKQISPHNTRDFNAVPCDAIIVVGDDDEQGGVSVAIQTAGGDRVYLSLISGMIHPIKAKRIRLTGTKTSKVFALWKEKV